MNATLRSLQQTTTHGLFIVPSQLWYVGDVA
jgi:hypothetical protein